MAEWARLLSECWVKPVAGSNPVLPATKNAFLPKARNAFFVLSKIESKVWRLWNRSKLTTGVVDSNKSERLLQTHLHPQVTSLKPQPFIKAMRVKPRLVSCQLNNVSLALSGAFHCPLHHLAANSLALKSLIHSY